MAGIKREITKLIYISGTHKKTMKRLIPILGILLIASYCFGGNADQVLTSSPFTGGLNTSIDSLLINDNEISGGQNSYQYNGTWKKRRGYEKLNSSQIATKDITGLYEYVQKDGTNYFIATCGTNIYKMDNSANDPDGTWDSITGAATITDGSRFSFATFRDSSNNDLLLAFNGDAAPLKWTGSGNVASLGGTPPAGKYVVVAKNRVWVAGVSAASSVLYYSNTNDCEDWAGGGTISVNLNDGDLITGLGVIKITNYSGVFERIVVFKNRSIYVINADDNDDTYWTVTRISNYVGCISHWTIKQIDNYLLFLAKDGIYAIDDNGTLSKVSSKIDTTIKGYASYYFTLASAEVYRPLNQYLIALPYTGATTCTRIIPFNYLTKTWDTPYTISCNRSMCVKYFTSGSERLYFGNNGYVYRFDYGDDDDSSDIDGYIITKNYSFGSVNAMKRIRYIYTLALAVSSSYNMITSYSIDTSSTFTPDSFSLATAGTLWGSFTWGVDIWGGAAYYIRHRTDVDQQCFSLRLKIQTENKDEPFTLFAYWIDYEIIPRDNY